MTSVLTPTYRASTSKCRSGMRRMPSDQYLRRASLPRITPSPLNSRTATGEVKTTSSVKCASSASTSWAFQSLAHCSANACASALSMRHMLPHGMPQRWSPSARRLLRAGYRQDLEPHLLAGEFPQCGAQPVGIQLAPDPFVLAGRAVEAARAVGPCGAAGDAHMVRRVIHLHGRQADRLVDAPLHRIADRGVLDNSPAGHGVLL